jgi:type IV secretion system protein VirD4
MSTPPRPPRKRPAAGLPLGWESGPSAGRQLGFGAAGGARPRPELLLHDRDSHLITIAPTGAGKGRSGVIPALLTHPGPTLTIDIKGENYLVAARRRRQLGHRVVGLDPFHLLLPEADGLNPFDLFALPGCQPDCDTEMLCELVAGGVPMMSKDLFWDITGRGLLTGLIGLAAEDDDPARRHLGTVLDYMFSDDVDYNLAVQLDTHKFKCALARQELVAYLSHEGDKCRPSVRSTAQTFVKSLGSQTVRQALSKTTFDLEGWRRGDKLDVFLIFPPDKLESHRALLRLLVGTLLVVLMRRSRIPGERTLLLIDEAAQLGKLAHLKTALTLLRGYGVTVWTFWQDLSQLRASFEGDWETVLNNSGVVQVYGMTNGRMASACAEVLGMEAGELLRMEPDEQVLLRPGNGPRVVRRVDYLTDALFKGLYDPNPRYACALSRC